MGSNQNYFGQYHSKTNKYDRLTEDFSILRQAAMPQETESIPVNDYSELELNRINKANDSTLGA